MNKAFAVLFAVLFLTLQSCAPQATTGIFGAPQQSSLSLLSLEMTKQEVRGTIGAPTVVRGSILNQYGEVIEVWEYRLYYYMDSIPGLSYSYDDYWLFFVDGILLQWGQAGDWARAADEIYELRFR